MTVDELYEQVVLEMEPLKYDPETDAFGYPDEIDDWEGIPMPCYTADFETTTDMDDCRVWAWAVCDIDNPDFVNVGNDLDVFMEYIGMLAPCKIYFHNLGFDGAFIFDYLLSHNWEHVKDKKQAGGGKFSSLISDMNQVYEIDIWYAKNREVRIYDSFKMIPLSVASVAKAYNLPILKGEIDYEAHREVGHEITEEEREYIEHDVKIMAMALAQNFAQGLDRMTAGSNALANYKQMVGGAKMFREPYPVLDKVADEFIRMSYKGGFTYADPRFKGKLLDEGRVYDVNSLYPSVMAAMDGQLLPYGMPEWYEGQYVQDDDYPLWIGCITFSFTLKPDHIPCIQVKGNWLYSPTQYLTQSEEPLTLIVTSVDWGLIQAQYDVYGVSYDGGYKFRASTEQFREYVGLWGEVKKQASREGNAGLRQIAKLMLNSLYGKFATKMTVQGRHPELIDGVVRYVDNEETDERDPVYLPVGTFITAHARNKTIKAAQANYSRFVYADTDSIHLVGDEEPEGIAVHDTELGAWAHESTFTRAKFLGAKCYVEEIGGELVVHVSGMPRSCHSEVTLDNFEVGARYWGKLYTHRVSGGIVLDPGYMEIRERT